EPPPLDDLRRLWTPPMLTCPECHGTLLRVADSPLLRFRCHTGHAYTAASLATEIDVAVEKSLWNSIRALEEAYTLKRQMAAHIRQFDRNHAEQLSADADAAQAQAEQLRSIATARWTASASRVG
ncbi:MAG: chemotaxis protein CheB, partial [Vicinamibacterales bacterium]